MTRGRRLALVALALASVALAAWAVWAVSLAPRRASDSPTGDPSAGLHPAGIPGLAARSEESPIPTAPLATDDEAMLPVFSPTSVRGTVVTEEGTPIPGAIVVAAPSEPESRPSALFRGDLPRATTDATGAFRLPASAVVATLVVAAPGFIGGETGPGTPGLAVRIVLQREHGRVTGRVTDEAGKPIAGARVYAGKMKTCDRERFEGAAATTDGDGTYSVSSPDEHPAISVASPGYASGKKWLRDHEAGKPLRADFVLVLEASVAGRVVDDDTGVGIVGARIPCEWLSDPVISGPNGEFRLTGWRSDDSGAPRAFAEGYEGESVGSDLRAGRINEIRLRRLFEYSGLVRDEFGRPFAGAEVRAEGGGTTTSGADGTFRIGASRGGWPDAHVVFIAAEGERTSAIAKVPAGTTDVVELRLGAPSPLVGRVVDERGVPRAGAQVTVFAKSVNIGREADAAGRFRFVGLPAGRYGIRVCPKPGADWWVTATAFVTPGEPSEEMRIVVSEGLTLKGTVVDESGAPVPARVRIVGGDVRVPEVEASTEGRFAVAHVPDRPVLVRVDDYHGACSDAWEGDVDPTEGEVRIVLRRRVAVRIDIRLAGSPPPTGTEVRVRSVHGPGIHCDRTAEVRGDAIAVTMDLLPGQHELEVGPLGEDQRIEKVGVEVPTGGGTVAAVARIDKSQRARQPKEVDLQALRVRVTGSVVFERLPVAEWSVIVVAREGGARPAESPVESEDGSFACDLVPGSYTACVSYAGTLGPDVPFVVREGTPIKDLLVAAPRMGLGITGRVLDPRGQPPEGARVSFFRDGVETRRVDTDPRGRFAAVGLAAGAYRIEIEAWEGCATLPAVSAGTEDILVRLSAKGHVRGRLRGPEGTRFSDATVWASREPGLREPATLESDGRFGIANLAPAEWRLHARAGPLVGWSAQPIQVGTGEVVRGVVLDLVPGGVVEGTLLGEDGKPVAGAEIVAWSGFAPAPPNVKADASGRFRFDGLAPGRWSLMVMLDEATGQDLAPLLDAEPGKTVRATFAEAR